MSAKPDALGYAVGLDARGFAAEAAELRRQHAEIERLRVVQIRTGGQDMSKHTPGPWFADPHGKVWRRPLHELNEYGGETAGDKPLATVERGWYGEGLVGYPIEANARLIAAAPDLLDALKVLVEAAEFSPLLCGFDALDRSRAAIAKAEGVQS